MTLGMGEVQYNINPRFVPDDIPLWLGGSKDSALVYDSANDEFTIQTTNASGTLTDRFRIQAGLDGSVNIVLVGNHLVQGAAYHELGEIADPAAPVADNARLYVRDNGAGKTQLVVRFPTGAVQVLATEP